MWQKFLAWVKAHPRVKTVTGWVLVVVGLTGIFTPFTPWGFLFFVGLELLGLRLALSKYIERFKIRRKTNDVKSIESSKNEE